VIPLALFFRSIYLGWFLSLVYALALYLSDRYKKESLITVGIAFTGGVLATLLVGFLHNILPMIARSTYSANLLSNVYDSFVKAAIPEEIIKLGVFFLTAWTFKLEDFSERFDGILYMGMIGAGFGAYEDFAYIFSHTFEQMGAESNAAVNAFQFITWQRAFPGHILINSISGYFLGCAKFESRQKSMHKLIGAGLLVAILLHGLFNLAGSSGGTGWLIIYVLALGRLFFFLRDRLLDRSPYRLIEQFTEDSNLYNWQLMENWESNRSIETYSRLYNEESSTSIGFFPLVISIFVLYPVAISGIYYINLMISKLLP